jgi:hypothetical protein
MGFGGDNSAAQAQQAIQDKQNANITRNVAGINSAFDNRGSQYTDYGNALTQQYQTELARQNQIAGRNMKFAGANAGLTGGSSMADQGQLLGQDMARGTLRGAEQVTGDVASLQAKDAATRQQMISLASTGGDIGNAAQMTADSLKANYGNASSANMVDSLGNVFGDVSANYNQQNTTAALRRGIQTGSSYATPWGKTPSSAPIGP